MRWTTGGVVAALVLFGAGSARAQAAPSWTMTLGPEQPVDIGNLHNAPNGHISFRSGAGGLTLWVAGRPASGQKGVQEVQGTFVLHPRSWDAADLESAAPARVFSAAHDSTLTCDAPEGWYRDYAAINSIVPGPRPGELLAFVDGEYHPLGRTPAGLPLLASIGLAASTDGVHWSAARQVIQGRDATDEGCATVAKSMTAAADNEGAASPSAVIREDGGQQFIYVYYFDRIRLTGRKTTQIYVARAPYSGEGAPGTWQKWTGSGWAPTADVKHAAAPVISTPKGAGEAVHPVVSFNTTLRRWLLVFHTHLDLYATSSTDGLAWDAPQALSAATGKGPKPAFPTLVSSGEPDQRTTAASGSLFYSRQEGTSYIGYQRTFAITQTIARAGPPPPHTPRLACAAAGGTWYGGRCH